MRPYQVGCGLHIHDQPVCLPGAGVSWKLLRVFRIEDEMAAASGP
jgi:hypothetical protein